MTTEMAQVADNQLMDPNILGSVVRHWWLLMWEASTDGEQVKLTKLPDQYLDPYIPTSWVLNIHPVGMNASKGLPMPDQKQSPRN
jgi:hypothetical protein